jgi:hypothetical protein
MMSDYNNYGPELTPGQKLRAALTLFVIGGGVLFLLIREVFF